MAITYMEAMTMADPTDLDDVEVRLKTLEMPMYRVLLIVGAAGDMLSGVRRPVDGEETG
jgi:hypothetical protein